MSSPFEKNKIKSRIEDILAAADLNPDSDQYRHIYSQMTELMAEEKESSLILHENVVNSSLVGTIVHNSDSAVFINQYLINLLGYDFDEYKGITIQEFIHPDDVVYNTKIVIDVWCQRANNTGAVLRVLHRDGHYVWVKSNVSYHANEEGLTTHVVINLVDLTDQMNEKEEKEKLNLIYKTLLEGAHEGLEVIHMNSEDPDDEKNKILVRNKAIKKILHDEDKLYIRLDEIQTVMPEYQPDGTPSKEVLSDNLSVLKSNQEMEAEVCFLVDGEMKEYSCRIRTLHVADEIIVLRNYQDISELRAKERKVLEKEGMFESLVEALPGGVAIIDAEGQMLYASAHSHSLFGYDPSEDGVSRSVMDYIVEEDYEKMQQMYHLATHEKGVEMDFTCIGKEGTFPAEIHAKRYYDGEGGKPKIISYTADVSDKRAAEREINQRKTIYETLINNSFDAIDILSVEIADGEMINPSIIMRNEKMEKIFGKEATVVSKKEILKFVSMPQEIKDQAYAVKTTELFTSGKLQMVFNSKNRKGEMKHFNGMFQIITVADQTFLIRIITDVTAEETHKMAMMERQKELEKYIESNLQLENFAYIASHDLKAPLRTVLSFSQLIKRSSYDKLDVRNQEFLDIVLEGTNNMMVLIEDLLTFSRVNTKKVQLETFEVQQLQDTVMLDLNSVIHSTGATVTWDVESSQIRADKVKITQIFENLIRNATKFVKSGENPVIQITEHADTKYHHFSIKDNGIGIKKEHFEKIFEVFSKLHSKDVYEGTGLGLSICARIVSQHQGRIWVESKLGEGSTFHFTINKDIKEII